MVIKHLRTTKDIYPAFDLIYSLVDDIHYKKIDIDLYEYLLKINELYNFITPKNKELINDHIRDNKIPKLLELIIKAINSNFDRMDLLNLSTNMELEFTMKDDIYSRDEVKVNGVPLNVDIKMDNLIKLSEIDKRLPLYLLSYLINNSTY